MFVCVCGQNEEEDVGEGGLNNSDDGMRKNETIYIYKVKAYKYITYLRVVYRLLLQNKSIIN